MEFRRDQYALYLCLLLIFSSIDKEISISPAEFPEQRLQARSSPVLPNCPSMCHCHQQLQRIITDCSEAGIKVIPAHIHNLTYELRLYKNNLTVLSYNDSLNKLEILNASENDIIYINSTWLISIKSLRTLDLSYNKLESENLGSTFSNSSLYSLSLSSNKLKKISSGIFRGAVKLKELDLSNNDIHRIDDASFKSLESLELLNLSSNKLVYLKHDWFKSLKELRSLWLSKNSLQLLSNIVFWPLNNLKNLDFSENMIDSVGLLSFKGLSRLETLNMSHNRIEILQEGTFRPFESIKVIDLSNNPLKSLERIFKYATSLNILYLKNMSKLEKLMPHSFSGITKLRSLELSGSKSLSVVSQHAFAGLRNLVHLDISECGIQTLRSGTFKEISTMAKVNMTGNFWNCDCYLYWMLLWLGEQADAHMLSPSETVCHSPSQLKGTVLLDALDHDMVCTNASISHFTHNAKFRVGSTAIIQCQADGSPKPNLTWVTPHNLTLQWVRAQNNTLTSNNHAISPRTSLGVQIPNGQIDAAYRNRFLLMRNGDLLIKNIERGDGGFYTCTAINAVSSTSVNIILILDYEYLNHIKIVSILVGLATSFGFLLLTLLSALVEMILKRCGVKCPCRSRRASPKSQQIRKILESMEHYKKQQMDKLRENYNSQVQRIKDNCMQQMERLRESYSSQAEKLRDIRDYGTLQIDRIRENYYQQVQRVREYSVSQIEKLRENYMLQRNKIRKFSTNHLYKLRENYKLQQQLLNKMLENLNLESCRNLGQRTDSMVFEPDLTLDNVFVPKICLAQSFSNNIADSVDNTSQLSAYFTPDDACSEISDSPEHIPHPCFESTLYALKSQSDCAVHCVTATSDIHAYDAPTSSFSAVNDFQLITVNSNEVNSNETIV